MFGKKAKIQECGNNYDGRKTICRRENQMSDVSKCCVRSFQAEWPHSPQRLGMGNAHTPLETTSSRTCCSGLAYIFADGNVACVFKNGKNEILQRINHWKELTS